MCVLTQTATEIAAEIKAIESTVKASALHGAIEIGKRLKKAKEIVPHGEWQNWCKENLGYSYRKAASFMQLADANMQTSATLTVSNALALLTLPEEERENFTETHDLNVSTRLLEQQIKEYKSMLSERDEKINGLQMQNTSYSNKISDLTTDIDSLETELQVARQAANADPVEVIKEVLPDDYEAVKREARRAKALERDVQTEKNRYAEQQKEVLQLKEQVKTLRRESEDAIGGMTISDNILYFEAGVLTFLDQYGGMAWLTQKIGDMPESSRNRYIRAITSIGAWAQTQMEILGTENGVFNK